MRKKPPYLLLILFFSILALMSLPKGTTESLRGTVVAFFTPLWEPLAKVKTFFSAQSNSADAHFSAHDEELQQLRLENSLLRAEILHLKESIQHELRLLNQMTAIPDRQIETNQTANFLKKRHRLELQKLLKLQLKAIPAHVIFRAPTSWNSSLWIDVGTATNEFLGSTIVAKNSPVLVGTSVVGVIDYVGKKQSRVRLITDSGLTPSVRALRTSTQTPLLIEKIHTLIHLLEKQKNVLADPEEQDSLIKHLETAAANLSPEAPFSYLAKGEIHGLSMPLWQGQRHLLKGIGFNYDFADGEGPARDLRSGKPLDPHSDLPATPILKTGDLLVTTGMDGVFPPDLLVAEVSKVHPLKEGDYYYELDALPTAGNLDDLSLVLVIAPVEYDTEAAK